MENNYLDVDEEIGTYGYTPGNLDFVTPDGSGPNDEEMTIETRLHLAERANEIYRDQVKYLQDHLNGLRALLQEKESIIENLTLRYDVGMLPQDPSRGSEYISPDKMDDKELRRKAEGLAQRTILENFELRELVNELRDESFHLRNEIYDLQDKLSRQALHISKITRSAQAANAQLIQNNYENATQMMKVANPNMDDEEAQRKHEERTAKHNRRQSSVAQPTDFWDKNENGNEQEEEEEEEEEADEIVTPNNDDQQMYNQDAARDSEANEDADNGQERYLDDEAKRKRQEREANSHKKKSTLVMPTGFFEEEQNDNLADDKLNKRRDSKKLDEVLNTEEAKAKRQERQEKEHNRQESAAVPSNLFETDHANTEEAKRVREERAKRARKESVAVPKTFLNSEDPHDSEDEETRQKRRKHQRKKSLMEAVGGKGHLSDEDTKTSRRADLADLETRKKTERVSRLKTKDSTIPEKSETTAHHRRESSLPQPDLGFEQPVVLLAAAQDEVKTLKENLRKMEEEKKSIEKQLQNNKQESQQMEEKLGQQLEKRIEEKFQKATSGLLEHNKKEMEQMNFRMTQLQKQLDHATDSKMGLIQCTNAEINRLNRVINTLLQSEKCKDITRLLLNDFTK